MHVGQGGSVTVRELGRGGEGLRVYSDSTDVPRMEHGEGSPQPVTKQQFLSF